LAQILVDFDASQPMSEFIPVASTGYIILKTVGANLIFVSVTLKLFG